MRGGESFGIVGTGAVTTSTMQKVIFSLLQVLTLAHMTIQVVDLSRNNLGDPADVTITSITDNDLLQYDTASGKWQNLITFTNDLQLYPQQVHITT